MKKFEELKQEFYDGVAEKGVFTTTNENGEQVVLEIGDDYLKTSTLQNNNWMRINIYHKDRTVEEFYER